MANMWLRLWHDMPTDPKWRTIARACELPISLVQSVYLHLLVDASRNVTRGHATVTQEDLASSLDVTEREIQAVLDAMQGRVLDGMRLMGWDARQPKREDNVSGHSGAKSAAERKAEQRERERLAKENANVTQCHDESRNVTLDKDKEEDKEKIKALVPGVADDLFPRPAKPDCPHQEIIALYHEILPQCPAIRDWTPARQTQLRARWNESADRQSLDYWRGMFEYISRCDFLVGRSTKPFFADLEWITKSQNFTKIREGKYENR